MHAIHLAGPNRSTGQDGRRWVHRLVGQLCRLRPIRRQDAMPAVFRTAQVAENRPVCGLQRPCSLGQRPAAENAINRAAAKTHDRYGKSERH